VVHEFNLNAKLGALFNAFGKLVHTLQLGQDFSLMDHVENEGPDQSVNGHHNGGSVLKASKST
jgi:hypothetical protein